MDPLEFAKIAAPFVAAGVTVGGVWAAQKQAFGEMIQRVRHVEKDVDAIKEKITSHEDACKIEHSSHAQKLGEHSVAIAVLKEKVNG